jgi:hypothetical protein
MKLSLALVLMLALPSVAQQTPANPAPTPAQGMIRYSFEWNQGIPWQQYTVEVGANGKSHFQGTPHPGETNDSDPVEQDFTMSEANRQKLFELAQKLNYFHGDFDSHLKHIAQTGKKTLEFQSAENNGSTSFNWSQNADIEWLARFFGGIATTIDYGRKLEFQYRFDKLGMDQRLRELEDLQANNGVEELEIIVPILRKIAGDPNLMNISRETARKLLRNMEQPAPASQDTPQQ